MRLLSTIRRIGPVRGACRSAALALALLSAAVSPARSARPDAATIAGAVDSLAARAVAL